MVRDHDASPQFYPMVEMSSFPRVGEPYVLIVVSSHFLSTVSLVSLSEYRGRDQQECGDASEGRW
jgi:hypothetical protein